MVEVKLMFQMPWCQNHAEIIQGRRRIVEPSILPYFSYLTSFQESDFWLKENGEENVLYFKRTILVNVIIIYIHKHLVYNTRKFWKKWNLASEGARLGINLVRCSFFFGWFGRFKVRFWWMHLGLGGLRFGIFSFIPIPNGTFTHFLIFYEVRTFGSVQGSEVQSSVSEDEPRFGRFEVQIS